MVYVVDVAFHRGFQRLRLGVAGHQDHHFFRVQQRAHADGQRIFRHQADIAAEEARVGDAGVFGQRFDAGARTQRRSRLVERDMAVDAHAPMNRLILP